MYAKRVVVADKSEEYRLQDLLEEEKKKNVDLQSTCSSIKLELAVLKEEYSKLETEANWLKKYGTFQVGAHTSALHEIKYKMSLHKNIDLSREGGCRAMTYGRRIQTLMLSQKSNVTLFPGYGVRFVSAYNLQPAHFIRMSTKSIRDLSLDNDEELLAAASQDVSAYIYSVTNHTQIATITPSTTHTIWAAAFDKTRPKHLLLGSQQGSTYIYDVRNFNAYLEQLPTPGDFSPVIGIQSIPVTNDFRFGGFIVCKLQSIWFYEYTNSERIEQIKLAVDGPFASISYDNQTNTLLIGTKLGTKYPQTRLIVAYLAKIDQTTVLRTIRTIYGSRTQTGLSRSTQLNVGNDSLVASYLQDTKTVSLWDGRNGVKMQGFNVDDCIMDMCPMYLNDSTFLATLSDTKCRIFQIDSV